MKRNKVNNKKKYQVNLNNEKILPCSVRKTKRTLQKNPSIKKKKTSHNLKEINTNQKIFKKTLKVKNIKEANIKNEGIERINQKIDLEGTDHVDEDVYTVEIDNNDFEIDDIDIADGDYTATYFNDDKEPIEKVQIYGTPNGYKLLPILTDKEGRLKFSGDIKISPIYYKEKKIKGIVTSNQYRFSSVFDIKNEDITSFIIINRSSNNKVNAYLQNSPDNIIFEEDDPMMVINPLSFKVLTPTRFVRYQRIAFRSAIPNHPAKIDIYYQAQGNAE